jgi:hypothetical protein
MPLFQLCSADFRICLRLRLGLEQPCIRTACKCRCGSFPDALGTHYLTCTHGNQLDVRHETLVKACHEMVRAVDKQSNTKGLEDVLAPFKNGKGDRLVLDQLIYSFTRGGTDFGVDYAVCHPTAACCLRGARDKCLAAAESRGHGKVTKYDPACRSHDIEFQPAIIETFGAWGEGMDKIATSCSRLVVDTLPEGTATTWTADSFSAYHQQRIAITVQRGNAKAIRLRSARDFRASGLPQD